MNTTKTTQLNKIKSQYKSYFTLARKTLAKSKKLLNLIEKNINNYSKGAERLCSALYTQSTRLLQSVILLCNSGFDEEASILTRSLLENVSYLLFIAEQKHEERAELYQHSISLSVASAVKEFGSMRPKGGRKLDDKHYKERERKALEYFRSKHGKDKSVKDIKEKYTLKPRNASEQLKNREIKDFFRSTYGIFYRPASSVTHAEAPLRFVIDTENGIYLKRWSSGKLTKICLQSSTIFVLFTIEALNEFLKINKQFHIESMIDKLFNLIKNK